MTFREELVEKVAKIDHVLYVNLRAQISEVDFWNWVAHLCMFLGLKFTLRFSRLFWSAMVTRFFASCACPAMPADAPPARSTPRAVRWRGRQKPPSRTRARGLWKKLRPVFGCRLPSPDFGAKIFSAPVNFEKSTCQLKTNSDFKSQLILVNLSTSKIRFQMSTYHLGEVSWKSDQKPPYLTLYKNQFFPETQGGYSKNI